MSINTNTENASQSPLVSEQTDPGEGTAQKIEAKPALAAATTAKGQTRRAKSNALQLVGGDDTRLGSDATEVTPSTSTSTSSNLPKKTSKQEIVLGLLWRAEGATIDELMDAAAWQAHSVRGFLSGTIRKKLKLNLISDVVGNGVRRYRVVSTDQAILGGEAGDQPTTDGFANAKGA